MSELVLNGPARARGRSAQLVRGRGPPQREGEPGPRPRSRQLARPWWSVGGRLAGHLVPRSWATVPRLVPWSPASSPTPVQVAVPRHRWPSSPPRSLRRPRVLAVLLAARTTGQLVPPPPGLTDPGDLVRYGQPVVRVVHDLSAAMTLGLILLAVGIVPGASFGRRLHRIRRLALWSGSVWALAGWSGRPHLLGHLRNRRREPRLPVAAADLRVVGRRHPIGLVSVALVWVAVTFLVIATSRVGVTAAGAFAALGSARARPAGHSSGAVDQRRQSTRSASTSSARRSGSAG